MTIQLREAEMVEVLGIPLYDGSICDAVNDIMTLGDSHERSNRLVSATGAHGLVVAKHQDGFANLLRTFFMNLADGMPAVWIARAKGATKIQR